MATVDKPSGLPRLMAIGEDGFGRARPAGALRGIAGTRPPEPPGGRPATCCGAPSILPPNSTARRSANRASRTFLIRSRWRTSWRICGWTSPRSAPPCCTTSSKTRACRLSVIADEFGARRGAPGGRRNQDQPPRTGFSGSPPGRERAQDASGHGHRCSRGPGEAGRPPAQHAHIGISVAAKSRSASRAKRWTSTLPSPTGLGMGAIRGDLEDLAFQLSRASPPMPNCKRPYRHAARNLRHS